MTAQIPDLLRYRGIEYAVSLFSQPTLFDPAILKLKPSIVSTACNRGYQAVFAISNSRLVLDTLRVNLLRGLRYRREGPVINGIAPTEPSEEYRFFNNYYQGLNYPIDYTGGILIADEFIRELYVHLGFQSPWKYKKVIELIFENGILKHEFDRSESIAHLREIILDANNNSPLSYPLASGDRDRIRGLVKRMFERFYEIV